MKTGNTGTGTGPPVLDQEASMEPGHEDREYMTSLVLLTANFMRLNGARS